MKDYSVVKKYLYILTASALVLFSSFIFVRSVISHIEYINFPYQHEYMEGAALTTTQLYVNNENPFAIKNQPQETYVYGFINPLIVSAFAKIYGNTLAVHRWVSYAFILLTCLLIFLALRTLKLNPVFCFAAAVILHQSFIYNGLIAVARPEGLGIFLFTLGILVPWKYKFSNLSCLISILLGTLGYFTKPYYVLVIPFIGIYMFLFVSKKRALLYALVSLIFLSVTMLIVAAMYESFHNNSLFHSINIATYEFSHMKNQLMQYAKVNVYIILIMIVSSFFILKNYLDKNQNNNSGKFFSNIRNNFFFTRSLNIFGNEPLVKTKYDFLFGLVCLFSTFLFIVKLGGHVGNGRGAYLYHIASPFLILTAFQLVKASNDKLLSSIVAVLLIYTLANQFKPARYDFKESVSCYEKLEEIIDQSKNPLNSAEIVSIMIEKNKSVYNSGHSEYFRVGLGSLSRLAGDSIKVAEREVEFEKNINDQILSKNFDVIFLTKGNHYRLIDSVSLIQNYQCTDTLCAYMPMKNWRIETWYPKK